MEQHFELLYIVSMKYAGDELNTIMGSVAGLIKENGGTITHDDVFAKQKLAYPIKGVHQGVYVVVEFDIETENVKKLERLLTLNNNILRYMLVKKKVKTAEELEREQKIQARILKRKEEELAALDEGKATKSISSEDKLVDVVTDDAVIEEKQTEPIVMEEAVEKQTVTEEKPAEDIIEKPEVKEVATDLEIKEKKVKASKVSLEDLDKKLDQILTDDIL